MSRHRSPHLVFRPTPEADLRSVGAVDGGGEWARAIAMATVGLTGIESAHFSPVPAPASALPSREDLDTAWRLWWQEEFAPRLLPIARAVVSAAGPAGDLPSLAREDAALSRLLESQPGQPERSLRAARSFRVAVRGQRHFPLWSRLEQAIEQGDLAGHFLLLLVVRAIAFQISPLPALAAVAYHEWRAGGLSLGLIQRLTPDDFVARHGDLLPLLHPAAAGEGSTEPLLRAI